MTARALQRQAAYADVEFEAIAVAAEHPENWREIVERTIAHPARRAAMTSYHDAHEFWTVPLVLVGPSWIEAGDRDDDWFSDVTYVEYLQSDEWRSFRERILLAAGHRCRVCNSGKSPHVHHRTYDRVGWERNDDVTVLCADCHDAHHRRHPR